MARTEKSAEFFIQRYDRMKSVRSNWDTLAQDACDYILPRKNVIEQTAPGQRKTDQIYDTTAITASQTCAAGLFSYLFQGDWFSLQPKDLALREDDEVKRWYQALSEEVKAQFAASNFQQEVHEGLLDLVSLPSMCIYLDEGGRDMLNFQSFSFGTYCIEENYMGMVDTVYRSFRYTPRQAIQKWGKGNVGENVMKKFNDPKQCDLPMLFLHCVEPREEYDAGKDDSIEMPFRSLYVEVEGKKIISEGGFKEMPYFVVRFLKGTDEIYGRSPGTDILPQVKMVNKMQQTNIVAAEKLVNPPWLVPDDGASSFRFNSRPNAMNYYRTNAMGAKPEIIETSTQLPVSMEMVMQERQVIEKAYFVDLFNMLAQYDKQMTATEVLQRVEEKLATVSPTTGRIEAEFSAPCIHRAIGIMIRSGRIPQPVPQQVIENPAYEVQYSGKIATAIKKVRNATAFQYIEGIAPLLQIDPAMAATFRATFNGPEFFRGTAYDSGLALEYTRPKEETEAIMAAEAQALAQQQQAELAEKAAGAFGKLPEKTQEAAIEQFPAQAG